MKTEKEKMLSGELYDASDPQLAAKRRQARLLIKQLNDSSEEETKLRAMVLKKLIGSAGNDLLSLLFIAIMAVISAWEIKYSLTSTA